MYLPSLNNRSQPTNQSFGIVPHHYEPVNVIGVDLKRLIQITGPSWALDLLRPTHTFLGDAVGTAASRLCTENNPLGAGAHRPEL